MVLKNVVMDIKPSFSKDILEVVDIISMILVLAKKRKDHQLAKIVTSLLYVLNVTSKELVSKWDKLMSRLILHSAQDPFVYQKDLNSEFGLNMDKKDKTWMETTSQWDQVSQSNTLNHVYWLITSLTPSWVLPRT